MTEKYTLSGKVFYNISGMGMSNLRQWIRLKIAEILFQFLPENM